MTEAKSVRRSPALCCLVAVVTVLAAVPSASGYARHAARVWQPHRIATWPLGKIPRRLVPAARRLRISGSRRRPRIIGGYTGVQGQWDFMAFVAYYDSSGNAQFVCSGTLVSPNVVLTAGHCAVDEDTGAALDPGVPRRDWRG